MGEAKWKDSQRRQLIGEIVVQIMKERADPASHMTMPQWEKFIGDRMLGAPGGYPRGMLNANDEGELHLAIGSGGDDGKTTIIDFGKQVKWIGLPREQAIEFAHRVIEHTMGVRCAVHISPLKIDGEAVKGE